jgi:hypothetical protein
VRPNIPGSGDVYVNTPYHGSDPSKKVYCPLCYDDLREVPMVFDEKNEIWTCNYCKYYMRKHHTPIEDSVLTAGNEEKFEKPYMRTVNVNRKRKDVHNRTKYNNPSEAWSDAAF